MREVQGVSAPIKTTKKTTKKRRHMRELNNH